MKPLSEEALDRLLSSLAIAPPSPQWMERIEQQAWMHAQQPGFTARLAAWLAGRLGGLSSPFDGLRWRLAGTFAALALSFSAGYVVHGWSDNGTMSLYAFDDMEDLDI